MDLWINGVQWTDASKGQSIDKMLQKSAVTRLANGIRVATVDSRGSMCSTGLLIQTSATLQSGTQDQRRKRQGSWFALEKIFATALQEAVDAAPPAWAMTGVQFKRDHLMAVGVTEGQHLASITETLARQFQNMTSACASDETLPQSIAEYDWEQMLLTRPTDAVFDLMHEVAFAESAFDYSLRTLSQNPACLNPRIASQEAISCPENIVLIASGEGVNHEQFVELANKLYGDFKSTEMNQQLEQTSTDNCPKAVSIVEPLSEDLVHVGVATESVGQSCDRPFIATSVLQMLLGGGGSFSSGGPGKGMYSRLYTQVLNRNFWLESCKQMHAAYHIKQPQLQPSAIGGFFGIQASAQPRHLERMLSLQARILKRLPEESISGEELERAKMQLFSAVAGALESRSQATELAAQQVAFVGRVIDPAELRESIMGVREEDVRSVAWRIRERILSNEAFLVVLGREQLGRASLERLATIAASFDSQ